MGPGNQPAAPCSRQSLHVQWHPRVTVAVIVSGLHEPEAGVSFARGCYAADGGGTVGIPGGAMTARVNRAPSMLGIFSLFWLLLTATACGSSSTSHGESGRIELSLTLPNGVGLDQVQYSISGPNSYLTNGTIQTPDAGTSFSTQVDGLPVASGYTLQLSAWERNSNLQCSGSTQFDVMPEATVAVMVTLHCPGTRRTGSATIQGLVDLCPVVDWITPKTSDDGKSIALSASVRDDDGDPELLHYTWSASAGTFDDRAARSSVLMCPLAGGGVQVTLEVSDGSCTDQSTLTVTCNLPASCQSGGMPAADGGMPEPAVSEAVAYRINPSHAGVQPGDTLRLPLAPRWTHTFDSSRISYPLAASGRVFVTVGSETGYGGGLYALDAADGSVLWGPVALGGTYWSLHAAYDRGRVFVLNFDGLMTAFDDASGAQLWVTKLPNQWWFDAPPTAWGGRVYAEGGGSGGTLFAVDAVDGSVVWSAPVAGTSSSPAVSALGVFVANPCNHVSSFSFECGTTLWSYAGDCSGGGGSTPALIDGRLYTQDSNGNLIFDAISGTVIGTFGSNILPAGGDDVIYMIEDGVLAARRPGEAKRLWSFGDGSFNSSPIVVGQHVVVAAPRTLNVLSSSDGTLVSSYEMNAEILPTSTGPYNGLAAAENQLYVSAGNGLTAF